ncbi:MAG TPA: AsmA family protein [Steroidobacteraceae bacterium]|nr:AsmA family protein [Steroidobacteraceae bacterium]
MNASFALRRSLKWLGLLLLALLGLALAAAAALDAGYFHDSLVKLISAKTERPVQVEGELRLHILSTHPRLQAERVTIGSPPWTPPGTSVTAARVTVIFATPSLGLDIMVDRLEVEGAVLHLFRDATGHANWQVKNPDKSDPQGLPVIHSLSMPGARVSLNDEQKHRQFEGTVTAQDAGRGAAPPPLRIEGKGQLNGRPVEFDLDGDPLATARADKHFAFSFSERSSGSRLTGKGFLLQPFDLHQFDATFEASGADLKDIYYLTGTRLIDTGSYHLTGKLSRRGYVSSFSDLNVTSGQSGARGTAAIDTTRGLTTIRVDLESQLLRLADLGPRAAGRDPESPENANLFMSSATPDPSAMRRSEVAFKFRAQQLEIGPLKLTAVNLKMTDDHGEVAVGPVSAQLLGGKLTGDLKIDARKAIPSVSIDARISDVQLGQYPRKKPGPPAIEGPLTIRANLKGQGRSMHEVASSAEGTLSAVLPGGLVRDSLAELTGIDFRGLGLLLTKNKREVPVRCGVANFVAAGGTLTAKDLVLDTEPVLIAGEGSVRLDTETVDLILRGYPKEMRILQLRAPIEIHGTLKNPSVGIQARDSKLVLVDPGHAKDADCASLLK